MRRACLVGAGFIAHAHAEAVHKSKCASAVAVVDPNRSSAEALAKRWQIQHVFGSAEEAIRAGVADAAHILAPPPAHFELARKFLAAGMDVLIEKPMAVTSRDCRELAALAEAKHLTLAVNQNSLFQTPFQKLENLVASGQLGPLRSIDCQFQMPLAQFTARQFGHWMFAKPENILLEQAVHPLAQILGLAGKAEEISVLTGEPYEMSPSNYLYRSWQIGLCCAIVRHNWLLLWRQSFPVCASQSYATTARRRPTCSRINSSCVGAADGPILRIIFWPPAMPHGKWSTKAAGISANTCYQPFAYSLAPIPSISELPAALTIFMAPPDSLRPPGPMANLARK